MSGLLGKLKNASTTIANKTASVMSDVWDKYGDVIAEQGLQLCIEAAKYGKQHIYDDQRYQQQIVDRLWDVMPPPVRLIGRDRLGWDSGLFGLRNKVFLIDGESVTVRPDAKEQLLAGMMGLFGVHAASDSNRLE